MASIHTIEARGNLLLKVTKDYFSLDDQVMNNEINKLHSEVIVSLKNKGIGYDKLRNCLTPSSESTTREIALIFDSNKINSSFYGYEVFDRIFPLLDKRSSHSFLSGDYVDFEIGQDILFKIFCSEVEMINESEYISSSQYYVVYINNLSFSFFNNLVSELSSFKGFVGYADTTYSSYLKDIFSFMLPNTFLQYKDKIIYPSECCEPDEENIYGYPSGKYGFLDSGISNNLFDMFLSYKIVRRGFDLNDIDDKIFSVMSISSIVFNINDFDVFLEDKKLIYLLDNKTGSMKKTGLFSLSKRDIENIILDGVKNSYIFNLIYLDKHNVIKFNIISEFFPEDGRPCRVTIALEYNPVDKVLRVVTLY